jgi:fido (protein-threonine AMPylation protein)
METAIIRDAKSLITDFDALRAFYQDLLLTEFEKPVDWGYVLQKLYLHACLKRQHAVAAWLEQIYNGVLDPIQQIAHRHMFAYGRQLLHRRRT